MKIKQILINFLKEEDGLTTVEYAVAGGIVASGDVGAFTELVGKVEDVIYGISDEIGGSDTDTEAG